MNLSRYMWDRIAAYAAHDDPMVAACNLIALVVASNQPFYPLYVYWTVSDHVWATVFTFLSTPLFMAVPAVARRYSKTGRALLPIAGMANTILSARVFGPPSGVDIFLIPCALIAATFFRASERPIAFALIGAVNLILRTLGHRQKVMRRIEISAQCRAHQVAAHLVHLIDGIANRPDTHIHIAARSHGRIGERQKFAGLVPPRQNGGKLSLVLCLLFFRQTTPFRHDLVKAKGHNLPLHGRL